MRALVYTRPGVVELLDIDEPQPTDGEILVEVVTVGICGSELHGIKNSDFRRPPLVMGHEFAGIASDGRRVTVNPLVSCRSCDLCVAGQQQLCRRRQILGIHRPGAFAEYVLVPQWAVHELPADMSFTTAALIEPLANAIHAMNLARPTRDSRVGILGAGTIGLVSLLVGLQFSDDVVVSDLSHTRLEVAERLGARSVGTSLHGEFHVIVDAVGAVETHSVSVQRLRPGGTAVWVGLLSSKPGFDGQEIVREEKRIAGSYCYTDTEFEQAVSLASKVPLDWATSFDLTDGVGIFNELMHGRDDVVKALLHPQGL